MAGYRPYPEYKDSGVEWLGDVPNGWTCKRLKFLVSSPLKYGANEAAELTDTDFPRYIRITDVNEDGTLKEETFRSLPPEIAKDYLLEDGDILLARSGATVGKTFIYRPSWGIAAYAGYLIRARMSSQIDASFSFYFLQSNIYWQWLNSIFIQATIQNVSAEKYASLWFPVPCKDEQQTIVRFLDHKTAQIDALIAKKEELLEKLAEKRTTLISHAVTKGLDPNAKMKDSGVELLGQVPTHWEVKRVKFVVGFIGSGKTPKGGSEVYVDEGIMLLRSQNIHDDGLRLSDVVFITDEADVAQSGTRVKPHDVLLNITGASIGRTSVVPNDFASANVNQHVCILRPNKKFVRPEYLHLLFCSVQAKDQIVSSENGTSREGLNFQQVASLLFCFPSLEEQDNILVGINSIKSQLENMRAKVNLAIDKLKEYRSTLITQAVTGKIDLRNI